MCLASCSRDTPKRLSQLLVTIMQLFAPKRLDGEVRLRRIMTDTDPQTINVSISITSVLDLAIS